MGRPKGGKNRNHTKEHKLIVVLDYLNNELTIKEILSKYSLSASLLNKWVNLYKKYGAEALENKKKTGNKVAALHTSKNLTELERLKLENLKLRIENERLKKGYTVKEVNEAHAGLSKKNMK